MNMILHGHPTADIWGKGDSTLSTPYFKNPDDSLKTFDFAVANPPFSDKAWSNGLDPANDKFHRFEYGIPPAKRGDYAFLLHLIKSLKSKGKGVIILPLGVLFRGKKEADIRRNLIKRGLIKGIIGLPANLFYGTGIPACIVLIDKENAHARTGIFMIDASKGFMKDGNKNRLRSRDIHKIVDVFKKQAELPRYSRMVPVAEISNPANDYNLNIPRYIDSSEPEDLHDLDAHLRGGIPNRDIDDLEAYWDEFPSLREVLFKPGDRSGYSEAKVETRQVKATILAQNEFKAYAERVSAVFNEWRKAHDALLNGLQKEVKPKEVIHKLSEDLLERFTDLPLLSRYDVYQCLMDYWAEVMQDDVYLVTTDGWVEAVKPRGIIEYNKQKVKETPDLTIKRKKYKMDLIPPALVVARYFVEEQAELDRLETNVNEVTARKEEFEEEHCGEEGALNGLEGKSGIAKGKVQDRVMVLKEAILKAFAEATPEHKQAKQISKSRFSFNPWHKGVIDDDELFAELDILYDYLQLVDEESEKKKTHKQAMNTLLNAVVEKYPKLSETDIKMLVVDDKWFASIQSAIDGEAERLTQGLATRIKELEERYAHTLPELEHDVDKLSNKVEKHLKEMGLVW